MYFCNKKGDPYGLVLQAKVIVGLVLKISNNDTNTIFMYFWNISSNWSNKMKIWKSDTTTI